MPDLTKITETQTAPEEVQPPRSAPPPSRKKPAGQGRKKLIKRLIALGVAAAVFGGGGFALYRFLNSSDDTLGEIYATPAFIGTIQSRVSGQGNAKAKETAAITLTQSGVVQEVFVTSGQYVRQGDLIALVGRTGNASGNHCHFEIKINGVVMNPANFIGNYWPGY